MNELTEKQKKINLFFYIAVFAAAASGLATIFGSIAISCLYPDAFQAYFITSASVTLVLAVVMVVLMRKFTAEVLTADQVTIPFFTDEEFVDSLEQKLYSDDFVKMIAPVLLSPSGEMTIYLRKKRSDWVKCFAIVHAPKISNTLIESCQEGFSKALEDYYNTTRISDRFLTTFIFSVDHVDSEFEEFMNEGIGYTDHIFTFLVGISFQEKRMWLNKLKSGYGIEAHRKMRKEWIKMMELEDQIEL